VSTFNAQQNEASLKIQIANVARILEGHEAKLRALDDELNAHSNQRLQYQLLGSICTSLDKLGEMGASDLFWDREGTGYSPEKQLQRVRGAVTEFEHNIAAIEGMRSGVQVDIKKDSIALHLLNDELAELEEDAESARHEFAIVREAAVLPFHPLLMPWSKQGDDERRYRKIMLIVLFFVILFGIAVILLKAPAEKREEEIIPEHITELLVKKKSEPKPVEQKLPEKSTETKVDKAPATGAKPAPAEIQQARATAETKGVLALKSGFADLMGDSSDSAKMGADARISTSGKAAAGESPQRSVIGSQAAGGSGGIYTAGLGRQGVGSGSGGKSITGGGVKLARVESATGAGVADDRPLSKGAGPSRTDEEIQIVFDRYKSALYRIYNRELRNDPSLRGKMVLRITIDPDGHVSACSVKSTDLASPALSKDIVERVLNFNFGSKAGVPVLTILYPIDFLPAS
jgi:outer membrane biosynthesis protein TonB